MKKGFLIITEYLEPENEDFPVTQYVGWRSKKRLERWLFFLQKPYLEVVEVLLEGDTRIL